jgi:hypothetical protein
MKNDKVLRLLTGYYGILQSSHMLVLLRAGLILLRTGEMKFPAPPPPGGWLLQTIPFLVGMGIVDAVAITQALFYVYYAVFRNQLIPQLGIISMTIAGSSALIFAIGTYASGAWMQHLFAYVAMVVLFSPTIFLFILLLNQSRDLKTKGDL